MTKRREILYLIAVVVLVGLCGQFYYSYHYRPIKDRDIQAYYNREIEANQKIIHEIQSADKFVYFAIYTFTRNDIKDALLGAKHRGLDVRGLTDSGQRAQIDIQKKIIKELRDADIPVAEQSHSALMHIKTLVTEKVYVTGSYNWTGAATDSNDEILEIGRDEKVRYQYEAILRKIIEKYQ